MRERKGERERGKGGGGRGGKGKAHTESTERRLCPLNPNNPLARAGTGKMVRTRS